MVRWILRWEDAAPGQLPRIVDYWGRGGFAALSQVHLRHPSDFHLSVEVWSVPQASADAVRTGVGAWHRFQAIARALAERNRAGRVGLASARRRRR